MNKLPPILRALVFITGCAFLAAWLVFLASVIAYGFRIWFHYLFS